MAINEATLEARIHSVLDNVFPSFRQFNIRHQKYFSIRFGHHDVTVDLETPSSRPTLATLDILLSMDGANLILLELKKEGLPLDDNDRDQGISYARLLHPMPPLVLVSNGEENRFYNTYTKEKIERTDVSMEYLQSLIDASFKLALADFKEAVNILLNREPALFSKVITAITGTRFKQQTGTIANLLKPVSEDFIIERKVVDKVYSLFTEDNNLVCLIGPSFSGKTNVLYQFYAKYSQVSGHYIFYLDVTDCHYSIFQQLANQFSKETKTAVTKDKIREWLANSLNSSADSRFFLLVDNFNKNINEEVKSEIFELIDIIQGTQHGVLFTMDEWAYNEQSTKEDRKYATIIGNLGEYCLLEELDDDEFSVAATLFENRFSSLFSNGAQYSSEYRQPRILKQLASFYGQQEFEPGQGTYIPAIPDFRYLQYFADNKIYSKNIHRYHKVMAAAFISDAANRSAIPTLNIAAVTFGAISLAMLQSTAEQNYAGLIKAGLFTIREYDSGLVLCLPKLPELMAYYLIDFLVFLVKDKLTKGESEREIHSYILRITRSVIYGDIVATGVILKLAEIAQDLVSLIINELINGAPENESLSPGARILLFDDEIGPINIRVAEDSLPIDGLSDPFSYSVLSFLAAYPMEGKKADSEDEFKSANFYIIGKIGSCDTFIPRVDFSSFSKIKAVHFHEIENVGEFVCRSCGIVEPIVQSIQVLFHKMANYFPYLFDKTFEENNVHLLWRLYLAMKGLTTVTQPEQAQIAQEFIDEFSTRYKEFFLLFLDGYNHENI